MKKIAVIHTTKATIESLSKLIGNIIEDVEIINMLDDSMLKDMIEKRNVDYIRERWISYAKIAETLEVDAILSACSTVGKFAEEADELLKTPVYRIDDAMAEVAVKMGGNIVVLATLETTLNPTVELLEKKSSKLDNSTNIKTRLVEDAYNLLMSGDVERHNEKIKNVILKENEKADIIVLAQASMANAIEDVDDEIKAKILTSPLLGIEKLKKQLEKMV